MPYDVSVSFSENKSLDGIEITVCAPEKNAQVEEILARFSEKDAFLDLPTEGGRIFRVRRDGIIRIYSQNRSNYVSVADETIRTTASVSDLAAQLNEGGFLRISRFEIINLEKVVRFDFSIAGQLKIKLEQDQTVYASRRYIPVIRDYLKGGEGK
ncbi:MAG: LytTR family transcriptional regulator [Clostridia bacterium]|nr:LytTR family transcriptional regulator [Clostridia bacterium]